MLDGTYEDLGEAIATNEGLQVEGTVNLESMEIERFENKQYLSEVDEVRIKETADIMAEVFSEDVIVNWSEFSLDKKADKINEYYVKAGQNLGIDTKGVVVEPMYSRPGMTSFGYNGGDGYIHVNATVLEDPGMFRQILDTATHEMRHQFQNDVISNPSAFSDLSEQVIGTWEYEFKNYISPDYDYQGYYEQAIESDARDFSENVMQSYMRKMQLN